MAFEPCTNCSSSDASSASTYFKFDCGMPILVNNANTTLSAIALSLRDWNIEISKYSLNSMVLKAGVSIEIIYEHSLIFARVSGAIRIKGYLPAQLTPTYDLTVVDVNFSNFGQKYAKIVLSNEGLVDYNISLLTVLSKASNI